MGNSSRHFGLALCNILCRHQATELTIPSRPLANSHSNTHFMKVMFIAIITFLLFTSFKLPGSGTAHLVCTSASGRTVFKAELQDITGLLEKAELVVDKNKIIFDSNDEVYTIFDPKVGVFTVYISGQTNDEFPNSRFIQLWAIPETFKIIKSERSDQRYEFKAKIEGTEPRKNKNLRIPQVELTCSLAYKI